MKLNLKAKTISIKEFIKIYKKDGFEVSIDMEMVEFLDQNVTILSYLENDNVFRIKEDGGKYYWEPSMLVNNMDLPQQIDVLLTEPVDDNHYAYVECNGEVHIGCHKMPFKDVEKIYKACNEQVKKYDRIVKSYKNRKK